MPEIITSQFDDYSPAGVSAFRFPAIKKMKGKENLGMEVDEERVKERGEVDRKDDKVDKSESPSFDDLLVVLGGFGRYQRWVYFFMFLPTIFSAMHKLAWVFLGAKVDHRQENILKLFFDKNEEFFFC